MAAVGALARSCHPAPTVAVTGFVTVLGGVAGLGAERCILLAAAVATGQLSIGWSNDRIDAARDRQVGRTDKPVATGELRLEVVDRALGLVLVATVTLSLLLGWRAGLVHLAAVGCGWVYNLGIKATAWSWLPYAVAFGALPAVATLAAPGHPAPAGWPVAAAALLGVAAHLANALPDLAGDRLTGVHGLPHRLGARSSLLTAVILLVSATAVIAFAPPGAPSAESLIVLVIAVGAATSGAGLFWSRPTGRGPFYAIIALVALDLLLIVATGHHLR